jgi:predicted transcriptional regulator
MTEERPHRDLTRRERQIMDIVYRFGRATAAEVQENLPDPPSYSAVRALLRVLEEKEHLRHVQEGPRYVYLPTVPAEKARKSALKRVLRTFFDDSAEKAVAALVSMSASDLSEEELERIRERIEEAKEEGR